MRFLTTAAVALALTGAAAAAQADQQQQHGQPNQAGHPHGQAGGQPHVQGAGQPHWSAGAAQRSFAGAPGGGQPHWQGQSVQRFNAVQGQQRNWQGQGGGQQGQARQYPAPKNGQGQQYWQGQPNGRAFNGRGDQRNWQAQQHWNGQGGQRWQGQGAASLGFQNHALRGRDQGRSWYSAGAFAPQYQAERRFHFGGYRYYPSGWYFRTWYFGQVLPWGWYQPDYYLDWADYSLPPPPIGCEWIAEGPDAVLVDVWTGQVLSVYQGVFWWNG